jgi:HAD superfamily hydrolase (TIGR01509 family)
MGAIPTAYIGIVEQRKTNAAPRGTLGEAAVIIFDCNGVLVDSEQIAARVAADEFARAGIPLTPELVPRSFSGRRPADMLASVEAATRRKLPANFGATIAAATLTRLRAELRAMPHAAHALTWLRGPKCVASSSPPARIRASLEATGLARFFNVLFSASDVPNGKPAPDLFLHAASRMGVQAADCIVVEDSPAGVTAASGGRYDRDRICWRQPRGCPPRRAADLGRGAHDRRRLATSKERRACAPQLIGGSAIFYCCRVVVFLALFGGFFSFLSPISSNPT